MDWELWRHKRTGSLALASYEADDELPDDPEEGFFYIKNPGEPDEFHWGEPGDIFLLDYERVV